MAKHASLGHWKSPITSELITSKVCGVVPTKATSIKRTALSPIAYLLQVLRLGSPTVLPNGDVFWLESRPAEQGRSVLVQRWA